MHMAQLMLLPFTVSCFSRIQIGFTFLVPADPGSPGQRAIERVCVCLCKNTNRKSELTIWQSLLVDIHDDDRSIPECQDQATMP